MGNTGLQRRRLEDRLDVSHDQIADIEARVGSTEDEMMVLRSVGDARFLDQDRQLETLRARVNDLTSDAAPRQNDEAEMKGTITLLKDLATGKFRLIISPNNI
jgi:hypothetical protein